MNLLISTPSSDIRPASNLGAAMGDNSTFTRRIPSFGLQSIHIKKSYQDNTELQQSRNVNLERRGSVTVALTCARTLVFPNVT